MLAHDEIHEFVISKHLAAISLSVSRWHWRIMLSHFSMQQARLQAANIISAPTISSTFIQLLLCGLATLWAP